MTNILTFGESLKDYLDEKIEEEKEKISTIHYKTLEDFRYHQGIIYGYASLANSIRDLSKKYIIGENITKERED